MNRKSLLTAFLLFLSLSVYGQQTRQLFTLFVTLPDSAVVGLTAQQRSRLVKNFEESKQQYDQELPFRLHTVDHRNGFLGLDGAFEGVWQMCYWNLPDGRKLICTYAEGCGPVCQAVQFDFYYYDGQHLEAVARSRIIPEFDTLETRFLRYSPEETYREFDQKDIVASVLYRIPRRGKNITVSFGNEEEDQTYRPYVHGTKIDLIWQDGTFRAGTPYW